MLDSKAAPYGDGQMSSSREAKGLAVPLSLFVAVAAARSAATAVIDGERGGGLHTIRHTFSPTCAIIQKPYGFGMAAPRAAQQHGRSACFAPGFALIHSAHGPPESA